MEFHHIKSKVLSATWRKKIEENFKVNIHFKEKYPTSILILEPTKLNFLIVILAKFFKEIFIGKKKNLKHLNINMINCVKK